MGFTVGHKRSEPNRGPSLECPIATGSAVSSQILWWIINVDFFATNAKASTMIKIHPVMIEKAADAGVVDSFDLPSKISNFSFN